MLVLKNLSGKKLYNFHDAQTYENGLYKILKVTQSDEIVGCNSSECMIKRKWTF